MLTGLSSPSKTSSLVKRSRHWASLTGPDLLGIGSDKSQNGSNVTEQCPHTEHSKQDFNWPTNISTILLSSYLRYLFQDSIAFWLSLKKKTLL